MKTYTVIGYWESSQQVFSEAYQADTPEAALHLCPHLSDDQPDFYLVACGEFVTPEDTIYGDEF